MERSGAVHIFQKCVKDDLMDVLAFQRLFENLLSPAFERHEIGRGGLIVKCDVHEIIVRKIADDGQRHAFVIPPHCRGRNRIAPAGPGMPMHLGNAQIDQFAKSRHRPNVMIAIPESSPPVKAAVLMNHGRAETAFAQSASDFELIEQTEHSVIPTPVN